MVIIMSTHPMNPKLITQKYAGGGGGGALIGAQSLCWVLYDASYLLPTHLVCVEGGFLPSGVSLGFWY